MPLSSADLIQAREAAAELLEELRLDAYLFEIEPRNGQWELRVECAIEEGWETMTLSVPKSLLLAGRDDRAARRRLLTDWRERLAACKVQMPKGLDQR